MSTKKPPKWMDKVKKPEVSRGKLETIKRAVREVRDLTLTHDSLTEQASSVKKKITELEMKKLPDIMEGAGVPSITLEAEGNLPAYEAKSKAYYSAGIKADWPDEDRTRAFDYLVSIGHGELIRTEVTYGFPKDTPPAVVDRFLREVRKIKLGAGKKAVSIPFPTLERGVNTQTLTAWLKDQVENEGFMPKLDLIGGFVGKKVSIKEVKEKKPRAGRKPEAV